MNAIEQSRPPRNVPNTHIYLKPSEVAAAIGRSRGFVYARIASREIPARRVAGALRIPLAAAIEWIESVTE